MLKGLDPLLTPALLYHLASMGHGDEVAVVDRNFPASATGRRLVRLAGSGLVAVAEAVLAVLPLDQFVPAPVAVMTREGNPQDLAVAVEAVVEMSAAAAGRPVDFEPLAPQSFYRRARLSFLVVATGEEQLYGCVLLRKGVVYPGGRVSA